MFSLDRNINPYLAFLIVTILGSVMTMVITRTADAVSILQDHVAELAAGAG